MWPGWQIPTLHPTFQLSLVSARSSTVHLQAQKASLMVSGLEPGVLYLVEMRGPGMWAEVPKPN